MNLLIDLRWMVIGEAGGMEQLAFELVASLDRIGSGGRIFVYCPRRTFREWKLSGETDVEPIFSDEYDLVPEHAVFADPNERRGRRSKKLGIVKKGADYSSEKSTVEIDLVHSIGGYLSSDLMGYRSVVTILDLQHLHYPDFFSSSEVRARNKNHRDAIANSDGIICISEAVKKDVCRHFPMAEGKTNCIWVIPSSLSWIEIPESVLSKTLSSLGLSGDYLYFPSHAWPHKNHATLLRAFVEVRKTCAELSLVMTGGQLGSQDPVHDVIQQLGLQDSVKHLGYRTPLEVRCLLQKAKILVYPSFFEGFGLPVAEAIVAGVPVACSNIAPLKEIGGDAIVPFNPADAADMAAKIAALATDRSLRDKKLSEGRTRRSLFSADRIGIATLNFYRSVCGVDPIARQPLAFVPSLRRERARHALRQFDAFCSQRNLSRAVGLWIRAFFDDPVLALTILADNWSSRKIDSIPFSGRHEDGWIGPLYRGWFMAPQFSNRFEIEFEGPPAPFFKKASFKIAVNGKETRVCRFGDEIGITVAVDLPESKDPLLLVEIESNQSFTPRDYGLSEDSRELSLKLKSLRWKFH